MNHLSDDILIRGIRNRDDTAFKYLQVKFQDGIRLMVMEMGGTLVYALCNKKWKQQLEKQAAARNYHFRREAPEPPPDFTEDTDEELYRNIFWGSYRQLDDPCKKILEGYLKEISPREIARLIESHPDFIKIKEAEAILAEETSNLFS